MERSQVNFEKQHILSQSRTSSKGTAIVYDRAPLPTSEVLRAMVLVGAIAVILSILFYDSMIPAIAGFGPALFFYIRKRRAYVRNRRKERLKKEFLYSAGLLGDYLRSGYSIENALVRSRKELIEVWGKHSDIVNEWTMMAARLGINASAEEVFRDFGERSGIPEIREFTDIFSIIKRSGGQLGEIIASVTAMLSEQFSVDEQIVTMIAAKRMEQRIMDVMPAAILLYVRVASPDLISVMYAGLTGRLIMTGCLVSYGVAYFWSEKILTVHMK